jgi:hypothetical protein
MASIAKLKTTGGSGLGEDKEKRVVKDHGLKKVDKSLYHS